MTKPLLCPKCQHEQTCPCDACQARKPTPKPWRADGDLISCGECGYTAHGDWWESESVRQHPEEWE